LIRLSSPHPDLIIAIIFSSHELNLIKSIVRLILFHKSIVFPVFWTVIVKMGFITGIAHVNLLVPKGTLDQARAFYGTTLGFDVVPVPALQKETLAWLVQR